MATIFLSFTFIRVILIQFRFEHLQYSQFNPYPNLLSSWVLMNGDQNVRFITLEVCSMRLITTRINHIIWIVVFERNTIIWITEIIYESPKIDTNYHTSIEANIFLSRLKIAKTFQILATLQIIYQIISNFEI